MIEASNRQIRNGRSLDPLCWLGMTVGFGWALKGTAVLLCSLLLAGCHSEAEKHTVIISGAVHVYPSDTPPSVYPGPNFIDVLGPKDHVTVRQVVYRNGYMAVKVRLDDGREGWIFSGESIELR
jgi:hypothetical protein